MACSSSSSLFFVSSLVLALSLLALAPRPSSAQTNCLVGIPPPVPAVNVLGQPNFTTSALTTILDQPLSVSVSPTTGKVFVGQLNGPFRLVRFATAALLTNGAPFELQFGPQGICTNVSFQQPYVFVDDQDNLWVADPLV